MSSTPSNARGDTPMSGLLSMLIAVSVTPSKACDGTDSMELSLRSSRSYVAVSPLKTGISVNFRFEQSMSPLSGHLHRALGHWVCVDTTSTTAKNRHTPDHSMMVVTSTSPCRPSCVGAFVGRSPTSRRHTTVPGLATLGRLYRWRCD